MNESCGKCKKKTRDQLLKCSGICNVHYHVKCIDMQPTEYDAVQKCAGIKWFCNACVEVLKYLWNLQNAVTDLQNQMSSEITEMRNAINKMQNNVKKADCVEKEKSYAHAASEVVIIKPKASGQDSKKTLEMVQKHVNPTALEVGISKIRNVKEGGVVIKCNTKEEVHKVKNAVEKKLGKNYKVNTPDLKNPHIKILDIDREMSSDELLDAIKKQNTFLNYNSEFLNVIIIKKMKSKWMAIVECNAESFKKIMKEKGLYIDWSRCRVYEYISVFRCFSCGGFGHKADECNNTSKCTRCLELVSEHEIDQSCDSPSKCVNCVDANNTLKTNFNVNHSVFDVNCPVLNKKLEIERQKIKYNVDCE